MPTDAPLDVEVWSDVICPWCRIGRAHLDLALAEFEHADRVRVTYRSFELEPNSPAEQDESVIDHLAAKYGGTTAQIAAFDVVMVTTPATDFGLIDDEDNNLQSDLVEALAGAGNTGRAVLTTLGADEAMAQMTAIPGIGPWTAEVYLLFCAGHPDIFPARDVALQSAVGAAFGHDRRPGDKLLAAIAADWSPWRGVAARLFWAYYGQMRGKEGAPGQG